MKTRTYPVFLSFFVMGFGDAVGTLVGFATKEFDLSRTMAGFLPFFAIIADYSIMMSFLLPLFSFVYITLLAVKTLKTT